MLPSTQAANAYTQTNRSMGTPRSIEYQAFQQVTARLSAADADNTPFEQIAEAVHTNTKLWLLLAADLLSKGNGFPDDLRAQLLSLAEFSRKHGAKILKRDADAKLSELVELNTIIMRGLRGISPGAAETDAKG